MGISTLLSFSIVNPIHAQNLNQNILTQETIPSTLDNEEIILAGDFYNHRGYDSRHGRQNQRIIIVPGVGNTNLHNGNLRRNNTYWNNNNRNINSGYYDSGSHYPRDIYQGNIRRNRSNRINERDRRFRQTERQCIHRVFQSAWGEIHCRSNNPSFEWRTIYLD